MYCKDKYCNARGKRYNILLHNLIIINSNLKCFSLIISKVIENRKALKLSLKRIWNFLYFLLDSCKVIGNKNKTARPKTICWRIIALNCKVKQTVFDVTKLLLLRIRKKMQTLNAKWLSQESIVHFSFQHSFSFWNSFLHLNFGKHLPNVRTVVKVFLGEKGGMHKKKRKILFETDFSSNVPLTF